MEHGGTHGLLPAPLLGGATGRDDSDHVGSILAAGGGIILSCRWREDHFLLCLSGNDPQLSAHLEVLSTVQGVGPRSAPDRNSLSRHDLVIGDPVLGWNRFKLERKILRGEQEVLIPGGSVDRQVPRSAKEEDAGQYSLAITKRAISLSGSASGPSDFRASTAISTNSLDLIFDSSTPKTEG